jgi:5-(hydroxymethyl)furfural/furfural oxidase
VIVCAGAIHSPALLLRAGIGPGAALSALGIPVLAHRPGVGANLMEHPAISISAWLRPEARLPATMRRHIHVALRWSSGEPGCPAQDMYMVAMCRTGWHPLGLRIGGLMTWTNKTFSRGQVSLASADPRAEPRVVFAMGSDARDVARLKTGLRKIAALYRHPALAEAVTDPFPTSYSERIRDLGRINRKNLVLTGLLSGIMEVSPWLRARIVRGVVTEGATLEQLLADDEAMEAFVRAKVHGIWHACGTCRMGDPADAMSVCDAAGQVIGVEGLGVCDASLMPAVPRANTNKPVIMLAERIADLTRGKI